MSSNMRKRGPAAAVAQQQQKQLQQQQLSKKNDNTNENTNSEEDLNDSRGHNTFGALKRFGAFGGSPSKGSKRKKIREVIWANPYISENDFVDFFYKPRTVVVGMTLLGALLIFYRWYFFPTENTVETNIKYGLGAIAWAFITWGMIHLPDGIMVRPHPAVWRAFMAVSILYMLFMVFLVFQDVPTIRAICGFLDPKLRKDLPEHSYAEDCRLSTPDDPYKWFHTIFDEFLIAHALGYFFKMIILRDWRIVTLVSLSFEVVEVSLQHILPNFAECWWDHVIIDVLICNAGGTALGYLVLKLVGARKYRWAKMTDIPSVAGKVKRLVSQFYPREVDPYEWAMFSSPRRLLQVIGLLSIVLMQEVNSFTMKNILHIPTTHPLVVGRLVVWGMIAIPGIRDFYVYTTDTDADRLGIAAFNAMATLLFETTFIRKMVMEGNYFQESMPGHVGLPLCTAAFLFVLWFALYYGVKPLRNHLISRVFMNSIFYSIPIVLVLQFLVTNVDIQWKQKELDAIIEKYHLWDW